MRVVFDGHAPLLPSDTDSDQDLYTAREGPGYPRPKGATPIRVALVPAYRQCTSSNETHGPPLAFASCNPPVQASDFLTVGTGDANGQLNRFSGAVRLDAIVGSPANPADDADLGIGLGVTDVRQASDLADYTGELQLSWSFRFTDQDNGPGAATVQDLDFSVTAPCTATATNLEGASCSAHHQRRCLRQARSRSRAARSCRTWRACRLWTAVPTAMWTRPPATLCSCAREYSFLETRVGIVSRMRDRGAT